MSAEILHGKPIAERLRREVARDIEAFAQHFDGAVPGLATILVGSDPGSAAYVAGKQKASEEVGIQGFNFPLPESASREEVVEIIARLNARPDVSGILLQLPVPAHLDGVELTGMIDAEKDVDGLTPVSAGLLALGRPGLRPCTPLGVMHLLGVAGTALEGAEAVVVGRSNLFGKPVAQLLLGANATVIDVGVNRTDAGLVGDVDFDAVKEIAGVITPVPGGVGPLTVAFLLRNTLHAARMQRGAA